MFKLHQSFKGKLFVMTLGNSKVFLENAKHIPWVILVPMLNNKKNILDLSSKEQTNLQGEINAIGNCMKLFFNFDQINIASLGNITEQLHIHIIARFKQDPLWPDVVWNKTIERFESNEDLLYFYQKFIDKLKDISL